jgi:hypothetical protein
MVRFNPWLAAGDKQVTSMEHLQKLKRAARTAFADMPGVVGFGVGTNSVRVYFRDDRAKVSTAVPDMFRGVRIEKLVFGDEPMPYSRP